ncbi:hypothetical protein [Methanococcoides sp.]|uniref:hypothetical protein n=1 Tax=Methanococcoides sp. TaxID=1966350 RepID=UPI00272EAE71|nr:hypothetical protein [Methanococcoides sp.]
MSDFADNSTYSDSDNFDDFKQKAVDQVTERAIYRSTDSSVATNSDTLESFKKEL